MLITHTPRTHPHTLDKKLDFNKHLDEKTNKCNKIIGMMKKLFPGVTRQILLTIYKSFVRQTLDYAETVFLL